MNQFTKHSNSSIIKTNDATDATGTIYRSTSIHLQVSVMKCIYICFFFFSYRYRSNKLSSVVGSYDYLWVTWSNGLIERLSDINGSGLKLRLLMTAYTDNEGVLNGNNLYITINNNL